MSMLEPVIRAASADNPQKSGDYIQDGLLNCGICRTPKQCRVNFMGNEQVVACMCKCAKEQAAVEKAERRKQEEADRIMRLRNAGIVSQTHRNARFDADDGRNPAPMRTLRRYAERWDAVRSENIGLLLYGGVGTGKSYGAACIANYLIEHKTPVCMVNLSSVLNSIGGYQSEDKNSFIADLMRYPLLILDDVGMERQTEYALEQVFNVIDGLQAENEGISKQSVQYEADAALEKIRRNEAIMSMLSSFMPHYDFDPAKYTGYSAWKSTGLSVQERCLVF